MSRRILSIGRPFSLEANNVLDELAASDAADVTFLPDHLKERAEILTWMEKESQGREGFEGFVFWISHIPLIVPTDDALVAPLLPPFAREGTLKVVCGPGAGYDKAPVSYLSSNKVFYANTPESVAEPTAAHTVILVLTSLRHTTAAERSLRRGEWTSGGDSVANKTLGRSQVGLKLGILGMGSIGRKVARYLKEMGMIPYYHNRKRLAPELEGGAIFVESLDEFLKLSDVLSIHVPLSEATRGMIGAREMALLPKGAVLINVARGPVISEPALVEALKSGHLSAAGLDVFETESSAGIDPWLLESDRVTLTPHFAVNVSNVLPTIELEQLYNLQSWLDTGVPANAVNGGW
ncbi:D-isomer specific 2-hydroxyacid dehydrogenase [Mrakia frigida]|uniref:D-isomer specific 2-hydroxyacid dehydrogenase n=1 Tax=Mrakia frigida TaxID=29902 RepID=UPI003FCC0654